MKTEKRGRGRPEKKDKPSEKLTVLAHPSLKAKLMALRLIEKRPIYEIIEEALEAYIAKLPSEDRKAVEPLAARVDR
jgi:hypothetical protein